MVSDGMDELSQLRNRLEEVKRMMELFFMGSEKRLPARERDAISQAIRRFIPGQDAVVRFKHQNLMQRLLTMERYWQRTLKAIEEGRYERDLFKADFRGHQKPAVSVAPQQTRSDQHQRDEDDAAASFLAALGEAGAMPAVEIRGVRKSEGGMPKIAQRGQSKNDVD
ncbi:MAG: hypothetical protein ACPGQS_05185 [Bradymonadia bacterium]